MAKSIFSHWQECLQKLLREIRMEAGLTQEELARKLDRKQSFVSKYEIGERRLDLVEISQICRALDISLTRFTREFERRCMTLPLGVDRKKKSRK